MERRQFLNAAGVLALASLTSFDPSAAIAQATNVAFPGAVGWANTVGGRGGQILRVTSLASEGVGSLRWAIDQPGPRIVVFEVGGVIDMGGHTWRINEPFLTIAGQTAPSPGITLIRGGFDVATHDVIIRHLRVRAGEAGYPKMSGNDFDSFTTVAGSNVIVDHCSLTWATDENMSASGPRFTGDTPEQWRAGTSRKVTFSNNLAAESLSHSTHAKGEHSKGSLIHDNTSDILIYRNIYAHNRERNPLFKGGARGAIINNFIYNPGWRAMHYNLMANEWGDHVYQNGHMTIIGNVMRGGVDTADGLPLLMIGGDGDLDCYMRDNIAHDRHGLALPMVGSYTTGNAQIRMARRPIDLPAGLPIRAALGLERDLLMNVGARPWDRDGHDVRILADVAEGRGHIIDAESEVGGYPHLAPTSAPFNPDDWDLATMEPKHAGVLSADARARGT